MRMERVQSSNVAAVGYSPEEAKLAVTFKNADGSDGSTYHYHGISPDQYGHLMNAESVGKHLNSYIKPAAYKVEKV